MVGGVKYYQFKAWRNMSEFYENIQNKKGIYIIAEVGANHNGDMSLARKMIDSAKNCGCHCVKFQSWTPKSLIAEEEYKRNQKYDDSPKKHFGSLKEMVEKYYLREEQHYELKAYCDKIGIDFNSTPFSNNEVDLLEKLGVKFYKVASMDLNNLPLLEYIARKGKPVVLSTGMATIDEIANAISTIEATGNTKIVILHCIALYPPKLEDINLQNIKMLADKFPYPVGFSDHSFGSSIPLASAALGACLIEKHFTTDKNLPGWDHEISANPAEMEIIVRESNNISLAIGSWERVVSNEEEAKKLKFRRSVVAAKALAKGHDIELQDLAFKRPGTGISPDNLNQVLGRKLKRDIDADELLALSDVD